VLSSVQEPNQQAHTCQRSGFALADGIAQHCARVCGRSNFLSNSWEIFTVDARVHGGDQIIIFVSRDTGFRLKLRKTYESFDMSHSPSRFSIRCAPASLPQVRNTPLDPSFAPAASSTIAALSRLKRVVQNFRELENWFGSWGLWTVKSRNGKLIIRHNFAQLEFTIEPSQVTCNRCVLSSTRSAWLRRSKENLAFLVKHRATDTQFMCVALLGCFFLFWPLLTRVLAK